MSNGGLDRRQAFPLAIGSIAGSGILFLPSAVYAAAGSESLLVWLVAAVLCLPMLLMFRDIVRAHPEGRGIEDTVREGLGETVAAAVPLMFLALVVVGLPAGAVVAGRFVARVAGGGGATAGLCAAAILGGAVAVNRRGVRASARAQRVGALALLATATMLLATAAPDLDQGVRALTPHLAGIGAVVPTVTLAFWTFTGFENLTFLAREFRDPERDFLPVSTAALVAYGAFTVLLTAALAARVPRADVDRLAGLLQLAGGTGTHAVVAAAVAAVAAVVMLLNAVAWVWGMSRAAADAATARLLPPGLAATRSDGVPTAALSALAAAFAVSGTVLALRPGLVPTAIAAGSGVFVVLYVLCIAAYGRTHGATPHTIVNGGVVVVMVAALVGSGVAAVYGVGVLVAATAAVARRRRATTRWRIRPAGAVVCESTAVATRRTLEDGARTAPLTLRDGQDTR